MDEIGDLALPLQAKLLRVLQERSVQRLGSNVSVAVDVRVICATSRNLEEMVKVGTFRQDLYFRISVLKIEIPPLRNRTDDIPVLAEYFLRTFATAHAKDIRGISPGYLNALAGHDWPGNVRELQNVVERSVVLADGVRLGVEDLPAELGRRDVVGRHSARRLRKSGDGRTHRGTARASPGEGRTAARSLSRFLCAHSFCDCRYLWSASGFFS